MKVTPLTPQKNNKTKNRNVHPSQVNRTRGGGPPRGVGAEINTISIVTLENQGGLGSASRVDTWRVGFQVDDLRIQSHIRSVSTVIQ
jgi:hypothetical protein